MLPEAVYDADRVLARMAAERVSCLMGPPTVFHGLLHHPGRAAHDHLKRAHAAARLLGAPAVHRGRIAAGIGLAQTVGQGRRR